MNITEIKIGRDAKSGLLLLNVDGKAAPIKDAPACTEDVSREHALITVTDDNIITIKNLNIENDTFVNGYGVEQKRLSRDDRIELGRKHYLLPWTILDKLIPKFADIRPLKQVYEDYEAEKLRQEISERRFGVIRSATGLITMAAIMLSIFAGRNTLYIVLYALAGAISLGLFIMAFRAASQAPKRRIQLQKETEEKFCCPQCRHPLTLQKYSQIQSKRCPHCQAYFIK